MYMRDVISKLGFGEGICNWIRLLYTNIVNAVAINGWESESFPIRFGVRQGCPLSPALFVCCIEPFDVVIKKDVSLRGVTIPDSGSLQVKTSLYMDDVTVFCSYWWSVSRLLSICDQFELASGAKVNKGKSEAMFFGNWADRSFIPFTVRTDYLKVLGVWFGGAGACTKTWEECVLKLRQKLGRWEHQSLCIAGIMNESMRKGIITLIYKLKGKGKEIRNWQPILLLNAVYKILSKVIANWVRFVLGS
eukprot:g36244.t1